MTLRRLIKYLLNSPTHIKYMIRGSKVSFFTYIRHNVTVRNSNIGAFCYVGENSGLNCVDMGNYCSIATGVRIGDMEHSVDYYSTSPCLSDFGEANVRTKIGHDVWVGTQVCIKQGVNIGTGAVVGAQSFVNKDVPPYAIVVGTPAKILRYRFDEQLQKKLVKSRYWEYSPEKARNILSKIV